MTEFQKMVAEACYDTLKNHYPNLIIVTEQLVAAGESSEAIHAHVSKGCGEFLASTIACAADHIREMSNGQAVPLD